LILPSSLLLAGEEEEVKEKALKFGRIMYFFADPYQQSDAKHFEMLCEDNGIEPIVLNGEASSEVNIARMEDLIAKKVDGIIIQPFDPDSISATIDEARDAGIPVLMFQSPATKTKRPVPVVSFEEAPLAYEMGQIAARRWMEWYPDKPIFIGTVDIPQISMIHDGRVMAFVEGVMSVAPDAKHVANFDGAGVRDKSLAAGEDILQSHPEVNIVYGSNANMVLGALAAFEAAGRGKAKNGKPLTEIFVGTDGSEGEMLKIADPTSSFKLTMALAPAENAKILFDTLEKIVNGEIDMYSDYFTVVHDILINGWDMDLDEMQKFIEYEYFSKLDIKKELGL
jgi:ribose transport system substrate-binding protein